MSKKTKELELALHDVAVAAGWVMDRHGHLKATVRRAVRVAPGAPAREADFEYRLKMQTTSVRLERGPSPGWFKVGGCYLKDLKVLPDGSVLMGRHVIGNGVALAAAPKES